MDLWRRYSLLCSIGCTFVLPSCITKLDTHPLIACTAVSVMSMHSRLVALSCSVMCAVVWVPQVAHLGCMYRGLGIMCTAGWDLCPCASFLVGRG